MGTDEMNELAILRVRVARLERELLERNAVLSRVAEALRHGPVYVSEADRLLVMIERLTPT